MSEEFKPRQETGEKPKGEDEVDLDNLFGEEVFPDYTVGAPKAEAPAKDAEAEAFMNSQNLDDSLAAPLDGGASPVEAANDPGAAEFIKNLDFSGNETEALENVKISDAEKLQEGLYEKLASGTIDAADISAIGEALKSLTEEEGKNLSPENKQKMQSAKANLINIRTQATETV